MTALTNQGAASFEPLADALRLAILEDYSRIGGQLSGIGGLRTLETNSGLVAQRGESVLSLLRAADPQLELRGMRIVDVGCGFGSIAIYLAYLGAVVTAVDPHGERLQVGAAVASQFDLPVHWLEGSVQELPLADRSFDLALLNNSLCYVVPRPDRLVALVQVRRTLRPGGWLLMRNPNRTSLRDPFSSLPGINRLSPAGAALAARGLGRPRSNVRLLSARGQRAELRRVGFEVVKIAAPSRHTLAPIDRWAAPYHHALARRPGGAS